MRNDFGFYLEIGSDRDFDILDIWMEYLRVIIHRSYPPYACTDFEIALFHEIFITRTDPNKIFFWRYGLFIKNQDGQRVRDYIANLITKCEERGDIRKTFHECASFPLDSDEWNWPDTPDPRLVAAYMPKIVWHFERGPNAVAEGATMYDERVVVTTTWMYDGKEHTFTGYWYVTSVAFVCSRLETTDPYYRRYMLLGHSFQLEHLKQTLSKELKTFITVDPPCREDYLKHHFEYDELPNFYER